MTAEIIQFKHKEVTLSAVCNICETSWNATMPEQRYEMYQKQNRKHICPFCGNTETDVIKIHNH